MFVLVALKSKGGKSVSKSTQTHLIFRFLAHFSRVCLLAGLELFQSALFFPDKLGN